MLNLVGLTKKAGQVPRGSTLGAVSRDLKAAPRDELAARGVVRARSGGVAAKSLAGSSLRRFTKSATLEAAAKGKKKQSTPDILREFFGRSSQDSLDKSGRAPLPAAPRISHRLVRHNQALRDDYHYMTQLHTNKLAQKYALQEDAYAAYQLHSEYSQYTKLFEREILSQTDELETQVTPGERVGDYVYYMRSEEGKNNAIYCRKKVGSDSEQILLDPNAELLKYDVVHIATMKINEDQSKLLVLLDKSESETFDVHVKEINEDKELPIEITGVSNAEWAPDGRSFFYTEPDHLKRPHKIYRHVIGTPRSQDELIFTETDDKFFLDIARTKDRKFMTINANSKNTSELRLLDPNTPGAKPILVMSKQPGTEFFLDHVESGFVMVMADENDSNYKIMRCDDADIGKMSKWENLLPSTDSVKIDDLDTFKNFLVVYERHNGEVKVRVLDLKTRESKYLPLPFSIGHVQPGSNLDSNSETLRFTFSGPITPEIVYDYHFSTGKLEVLKEVKLPKADGARKAFDPTEYVVRRVEVPSAGGVKVPMTLIHRKDLGASADTPTLLHAYGSYGHNLETPFDASHLPLLERGWCIAMAHVRGGGEMGRKWYHGGRVLNKKNSFDDLTNCVQWLFNERITSGEWLVGKSASAGGMPFAVLANENPGMFKALVLRAPFLDIVTTMCDETLPLTVHEYEEWGNPASKEVFDYMYSYDPYWNIRAQEYPHLFIRSSAIDARVPASNHLRYVAKLRATKTDDNQLLLRIDDTHGHFGDVTRKGSAKTAAEEFSFIYGALNIVPSRI